MGLIWWINANLISRRDRRVPEELEAQAPQTVKMSSGFGLNGGKNLHIWAYTILEPQWLTAFVTGPSRCFPFWQEVLACYVVNTNTEDDSGKKKCVPVLEDYYECLHHKKEVGF